MVSEYAGTERRRLPRVDMSGAPECRLDIRTRVRVLDISHTGTLIASGVPFPPGTRAHLRTGVDTGLLAPVIQVQRNIEYTVDRQPVIALGATFVSMDEQSRRSLEAFLKKASA